MNWTSPGIGTTPQLAGELLKIKAGLQMTHIPYAGAGPANTAVLGGLVDFYVANYGSLTGLLSSGKVRPIAVTSKKRWPDLPNVPTLDELGIKDAESDTFQGLYAPAGTPKPIIERLAKELGKILADPETQKKIRSSSVCRWWPKVLRRSRLGSPAKCRCTRKSSTRPV